MAIAFPAGGVAYWLLETAGTSRWTFVICAALIFFTWGEIFSLFPSTCTDMFGPKYATTNTSLLYTAKGVSAFVVPLANILRNLYRQLALGVRRRRRYEFLVVALALFVVRPMRHLDQRVGKQDAWSVSPRNEASGLFAPGGIPRARRP